MRFRYKNRFDKERRDILKTLTAAGISKGLLKACPLVGGMMVARATEAQGGPNKSILLLAVGGALDSEWAPRGGMQLGPMSEPYEPVKNHMTFIQGGRKGGNEGHGVMFSHFTGPEPWNKQSFEVNMGRTMGANRPLPFLNLGVQTGSDQLTRLGNGGTASIDRPDSAMSLLSANLGGGGGGGGGGSTGTDPRALYVDAHRDAIRALEQRLGQHEREKLESHLDAITSLESRIQSSGGDDNGGSGGGTEAASCSSISTPAGNDSNFENTAHLQIEIAMLALSCNITSSVSIAFGHDNHEFFIPTYNDVVHQSHHCCPGVTDYNITVRHMSGLCARTISKAADAGILGSTIITQVSDMGDARAHDNNNVPMFVAGGGISGGRVISSGGRTDMDLFQAVANRLGANQHPDAQTWSSSPVSL